MAAPAPPGSQHMCHGAPVSLALAAAAVVAIAGVGADAEPVQRDFAPDAHTTALYLFKEGSGAQTAAEVGDEAAVLHGASWAVGRHYFAMATSSGYVGVPDSVATRPPGAFTVELWAKLSKLGGDLVCKNEAYMFRMSGSLTALISVQGGWKTISGSLPVRSKAWVHLALSYDAVTGVASTYIDGALDGTLTIEGGGPVTGTADMRIGQNDWAPSSSVADAKVDAFRVSNVARLFEPLYPPNPPPATAGNLVPNGDFELGLAAGWRNRGYGTPTLCWTAVRGGGADGGTCLKSVPGASELPVDLLSRPINIVPGRKYTWSAMLKTTTSHSADSVSASAVGISVIGTGSSEKFDSSVLGSYSSSPGTVWTKVAGQFAIPHDFKCPSVAFVLRDPGNTTQLWIDEVRLDEAESTGPIPLSDYIRLRLRSDLPAGHTFTQDPSSAMVLELEIFNKDTDRAHTVSLQPVITDWEETQVPLLASFDGIHLPPSGVAAVNLTLDTKSIGYFQLFFNFSATKQSWQHEAFVRYAVVAEMTNVGNASESLFAMNTHMEREPTPHLKQNLALLAKCGVKYIRAWWGWGMCEQQTRGQYDFTEYERQYEAVTNGTGMMIMPILLRYYNSEQLSFPPYVWREQTWAGPTASACSPGKPCIQLPPYPDQVPHYGAFTGAVASRFAGRVHAYEIWNEPTYTMGSAVYASLLQAAYPQIKAADPAATVVGFAGIPLTSTTPNATASIVSVLKLNPPFDVLSEHACSQLSEPDTAFPARMSAVKAALRDAGRDDSPIWHSEQGLQGENDGYGLPGEAEADIAQLYIRDLVTAWSQGSQKFFWFSQDVSVDYDFGVFYGLYIPRPRLLALNAAASLLEGLQYSKSFTEITSTFVHLFANRTTGATVAAIWSNETALEVTLPLSIAALQAYNTLANPSASLLTSHSNNTVISVPADRPIFIEITAESASDFEAAMASMSVKPTFPGKVEAKMMQEGLVVQVTLTGESSTPLDGVVDFGDGTEENDGATSKHFHSLARGSKVTLSLTVPLSRSDMVVAPPTEIRVRVGDRRILSSMFKIH